MTMQRQTAKIGQTTPPAQGGLLQRACACGKHTGGGECAECKQKREGTLQRAAADLTVGPAGDQFEQEAERAAAAVVGGVGPASTPAAPTGLQRRATADGSLGVAPPIVHDVLRSPGQPLDHATRSFMEPRFGRDFSGVRVHTDARAAESAQAVNALAYTVGRDVVFGAGQHQPRSSAGRRLMAHELVHVAQQSDKPIQAMLQRKEENNTDLAAIQGLPMYELLTRLSKFPENILDDEEAGDFVGGPRLVIAMRVVKAKIQKTIDFLTNNRLNLEALPPDQATAILSFLASPVPVESKSQKTTNTDLEIDITIVAPSNIWLRGEAKDGLQLDENKTHPGEQSSPDAISEFEKRLLDDRSIITGVILDPDTREIIGYRTSYADGISRLVDREGGFVVDTGTPLGLETPLVDPIDFASGLFGLAGSVAKTGAGIVGTVIAKGALKKGVGSGFKVTLGSIIKMRRASVALNRTIEGFEKAFPSHTGGGRVLTPNTRPAYVAPASPQPRPSLQDVINHGRVVSPGRVVTPPSPAAPAVAPVAPAARAVTPPSPATPAVATAHLANPFANWSEQEIDMVVESKETPALKGVKRPTMAGKSVPTRRIRRLDIDDLFLRPGETQRQALDRVNSVIGHRISDTPLRDAWEAARVKVLGDRDINTITREEMIGKNGFYDRVRDAFWDEVQTNDAAKRYLNNGGFDFTGGRAPLYQTSATNIGDQELRISLDHIEEKAIGENWRKAIDGYNLRLEFHNPNSSRESVQKKFPELR